MEYDIAVDLPFTIRLPDGSAMRIVGIEEFGGVLAAKIKHLSKDQYDAMMNEVDSATSG